MDHFFKPMCDFCDDKENKIKPDYPDARDVDPEEVGHVCAEHCDAYGICKLCGRVVPGTMAAFDLLGEENIESE